jgi:hypothetical protein
MATLVAMRTCRIVVAAAAALVVLWAPASAPAQQPEATDPTPGSPSGTIYHLPVDTGRSDAAPHPVGKGGKDGGTSGSTTSSDDEGTPGALYRSNNNFGTSSQVPGVASGGAAGKTGSEPNSGGSGGSKTASGEQPVAVAGAADTGEVSEPLTFGLLAVIIAAGAVLGLGLRRGRPNS